MTMVGALKKEFKNSPLYLQNMIGTLNRRLEYLNQLLALDEDSDDICLPHSIF